MPLPLIHEASHVFVVVILKPTKLRSTIGGIIGRALGAFFEVTEIDANVVEFVCTGPRCEVCPTSKPPHGLEERHDEVHPGIEERRKEVGGDEVVGFSQ